jgi:hypothetical protein
MSRNRITLKRKGKRTRERKKRERSHTLKREGRKTKRKRQKNNMDYSLIFPFIDYIAKLVPRHSMEIQNLRNHEVRRFAPQESSVRFAPSDSINSTLSFDIHQFPSVIITVSSFEFPITSAIM